MPHSLGNEPCTELETRAGIWKYDANKTGQVFSAKERYVSGIRNGEGFDFDTSGRLFVTQHGRDQLHEDWPELYTTEQGFELPAEEVMIVKDGAWYGWPWLWGDGSLAAITETIKNGVLEPKQHPGAMPPMGGVELSDENLKAVAAYVWSLGHKGEKK
jgi:glucose/arabinose dehydrogenase